MSPTEDDLRAALRHGEGEGALDANRLIARGHARRAQRRTRLLGGAATAVFVAALATGGALLANTGDNTGTAASAKSGQALIPMRTPAARPATPSASGILPGRGSTDGTRSSGSACPASPTHQLLPGGGSPGQFGAGGKLFPKPVKQVVVCGYTTGSRVKPHAPGHATLQGAAAQQIITSLENAAKRPPSTNCPDYQPATKRTLVFIGVTADGKALPPVTADLGGPICRTRVTNGTAVRYAWAPPNSIAAKLQALTPNVGTTQPNIIQPGGGNQKHGSPIHS